MSVEREVGGMGSIFVNCLTCAASGVIGAGEDGPSPRALNDLAVTSSRDSIDPTARLYAVTERLRAVPSESR